MAITEQEVADAMFAMIEEYNGKKKFKAGDLLKAMKEKFGEECDKKMGKSAIKSLVNSGRCVYTYFGGSFIEIPRKEGAAND